MDSEQYSKLKSQVLYVRSLASQLRVFVLKEKPSKVVIVYDKRFSLNVKKFKNVLLVPVRASEASKSFKCYIQILEKLSKANIDRRAVVVTIGGGIVSDLGGFIASTYLRGINWVNVPTTLLAMVDASYGGKTGINFSGFKNRIGSFYAPKQIWIDGEFLMTLKAREILSGLAEVYKYGLICDSKLFFDLTPQNVQSYIEKPNTLASVVIKSLKHKSLSVSRDPRDTNGKRELLNLGHTLAHAIESVAHSLQHGEAVAMGLRYAIIMSYEKKWLTASEKDRALNGLSPLSTIDLNAFSTEKLWLAMKKDKKNIKNQVRMVGLKKIGKAKAGMIVTETDHNKVVSELKAIN